MSKWKILHGAGDVAVYNGLKKIFHVFPEEAKIVCDILNELEDEVERLKAERQEWADLCIRKESDLERCKSDMLGAEEIYKFNYWREKNKHIQPSDSAIKITEKLIAAFRASQTKTNEG